MEIHDGTWYSIYAIQYYERISFVCATIPSFVVTTPQPGVTVVDCPDKFVRWLDHCYYKISNSDITDPRNAEAYCQSVDKNCHLVSIVYRDENEEVRYNLDGQETNTTWIGLVGNSIDNMSWIDGEPVGRMNWADAYEFHGTYRNFSCTTGDCCAAMIGKNLYVPGTGGAIGEWLITDCVRKPNDYPIRGFTCKMPTFTAIQGN
ncbi:hypothetical protein WR25_19787 [Diploscapter pachys]|uniref:C-type lectin domain-containing protein n=1 Tax=Diploscapter pachys TaxID=2018661 RepID=A0A2A2JDL0_9BILA|nr:hypothetical protein WR25_19787 [Diploscapter pachys]